MSVKLGSSIDWTMFSLYLKAQNENLTNLSKNIKPVIERISELCIGWSDDNSNRLFDWLWRNSSDGIQNPLTNLFECVYYENWEICRELKRLYPKTYSKYERIKTYADRPTPASIMVQPFTSWGKFEGRSEVNKNKANEFISTYEKDINLLDNYKNAIISLRNRMLKGEFGVKVLSTPIQNLNTRADKFSTFSKQLKTQLNNAIVKSNLISTLTILK